MTEQIEGWMFAIQTIQNEINRSVPMVNGKFTEKARILEQNIDPAMQRLQEAKMWLNSAKAVLEE
jgi:hypothetical protein